MLKANFTEVLEESNDILKKHIGEIMLCNLISFILLGIVIFATVLVSAFGMAMGGALNLGGIPIRILGIGAESVLFVFILALLFIPTVGVMRIASQRYSRQRVDAIDALVFSLKKILHMIGYAFMLLLLCIPGIVLFIVLLVLITGIKVLGDSVMENIHEISSAMSAIDTLVPGMMIVIYVGFSLLALFMFLIYHTLFLFGIPAIVEEGVGPIGAIKRSWQLVRHNFWNILGSILLIYLGKYAVVFCLQSIATVIAGFLVLFIKLMNFGGDSFSIFYALERILRWPIQIVYYLIVASIPHVVFYIMYYNQRFKYEGYDLELRLTEISRRS